MSQARTNKSVSFPMYPFSALHSFLHHPSLVCPCLTIPRSLHVSNFTLAIHILPLPFVRFVPPSKCCPFLASYWATTYLVWIIITIISLSLSLSPPTGDPDPQRRDSVKRRTAQYLQHAETLLNLHSPKHTPTHTQDQDT